MWGDSNLASEFKWRILVLYLLCGPLGWLAMILDTAQHIWWRYNGTHTGRPIWSKECWTYTYNAPLPVIPLVKLWGRLTGHSMLDALERENR
jgi:hypothetical protein